MHSSSSILFGVARYLDQHPDCDWEIGRDVDDHQPLNFGQNAGPGQAAMRGDRRIFITGERRGLRPIAATEHELPGEFPLTLGASRRAAAAFTPYTRESLNNGH